MHGDEVLWVEIGDPLVVNQLLFRLKKGGKQQLDLSPKALALWSLDLWEQLHLSGYLKPAAAEAVSGHLHIEARLL